MKKLLNFVFISIFLSSFIFGSSNLWAAAQRFDDKGHPICEFEDGSQPEGDSQVSPNSHVPQPVVPQPVPFNFGVATTPLAPIAFGEANLQVTPNSLAPQPAPFVFDSSFLQNSQGAAASPTPFVFGRTTNPQTPFVFTSVNPQMSLKPRKMFAPRKKGVLDDAEKRELINIIELRAQAFFYAIWESNERRTIAERGIMISFERKKFLQKQTRNAVNKASDAYLASGRRVQSTLRLIDACANMRGAFPYSSLDKIVADDALRLEMIKTKNFNEQALNFQFSTIDEGLQIAGRCTQQSFFDYIKDLQNLYSKTELELGLKPLPALFLELLNPSTDQISQLCKLILAMRVRSLIGQSTQYVHLNLFNGNARSAVVDRSKKIVSEICSKLLTADEINDLFLKEIQNVPQVLRDKILLLANCEEVVDLNHYLCIWCKQVGKDFAKEFICQGIFTELQDQLKKIFSGVDFKSSSGAKDSKNIWPNLVEKLKQLNLEFLIKTHNSETCATTQASVGSKEKALAAQRLAEKLIQEEAAEKKSLARRKAASPTQVPGKSKNGTKKSSNPEKPAAAPVDKKIHKQKQTFLSSYEAAAIRDVLPAVATYEDEPDSGWILCECRKIKARTSEDLQKEIEPCNAQDKHYPDFNCVIDLSRIDAGCSYQCKMFLYPKKACGNEANLLANLDYSGLPKYKKINDNNHAFSNLVEKIYGNLGNADKIETLHNGWIKIYISFPGRICWIGNLMEDACKEEPNGVFEFIILKRDKNPKDYAFCVHRFFRPVKR